jgi:hypothetical protein
LFVAPGRASCNSTARFAVRRRLRRPGILRALNKWTANLVLGSAHNGVFELIAEFMRDPDEPVTLRRNGSHGRRSPPAVASSLTRKSARGLSRRNHQLRKRGTIVLRCACRGNSAA